MTEPASDVAVLRDGHVATVEIRRPPHNFFDLALVRAIAEAYEGLEADPQCRAIVLAAQGTAFCAGASLAPAVAGEPRSGREPRLLYDQALRLFALRKPTIAAVHGPAIGGGLGLALSADFRITCPEGRFSANFSRLGMHCGFAISFTLPRVVGPQQAGLLLYTGRRISGDRAAAIGLADELVPQDQVRARALQLAHEIAASAPIAVESMRATLRAGLLEGVRQAVEREACEQKIHVQTADFSEGVRAMAARREPVFTRS